MKCFKNRASLVRTVYAVVSSILLLSLAMLFVPSSHIDSSQNNHLDNTKKVVKVVVSDFSK